MKAWIGVLLLTTTIAYAQPARYTIFVTSASTAGGFTDPSKARRDSIKDLQNKLKDSKVFQLVDAREGATLVLEVLDRSTKREVNGWTAIGGWGQNKSSLDVRLTVQGHEVEFTGTSGSKGMLTGHKDAAKKVIKQLEVWVKENAAQLAQ